MGPRAWERDYIIYSNMFLSLKLKMLLQSLKHGAKEFAAMIIEHANLPTVNDVLQHAV